MNPEAAAPLLDVKGICALLGVGDEYVYAHCNAADPEQYWEHERFGAGRGRIRFTATQVEAVLAKHKHRPAFQADTPEFDDAALSRGLLRLAS